MTRAPSLFAVFVSSTLLLLRSTCAYRSDALPGWHGEKSHLSDDIGPTECHVKEHLEYWGDVVHWGVNHVKESADECCSACKAHKAEAVNAGHGAKGCNTWVWCANRSGCGDQKFGECWLKYNSQPAATKVAQKGPYVQWTSALLLTESESEELKAKEAAYANEIRARLEDPENPHIFFDIEINNKPAGRIEMVLFAKDAPRAAENLRQLATGEHGPKFTMKGHNFYRIIDKFIDQTGANTDSVFGGQFKDDPGGLKLKHDRPGLLSMANSGPDTNTSHFSIVVAPAPHLDGHYTIFGEVVAGMDVVMAINALANKQRDTSPRGNAIIADCGQLS